MKSVLALLAARPVLIGIFYLLVLPVGLIMRILGGDPMAREMDPAATSYRVESRPADPSAMRRD